MNLSKMVILYKLVFFSPSPPKKTKSGRIQRTPAKLASCIVGKGKKKSSTKNDNMSEFTLATTTDETTGFPDLTATSFCEYVTSTSLDVNVSASQKHESPEKITK